MKRTLFLFLAALLLSSCNSKLEYNIWEFTHEKHTYISFDDIKDTLSEENRREVLGE